VSTPALVVEEEGASVGNFGAVTVVVIGVVAGDLGVGGCGVEAGRVDEAGVLLIGVVEEPKRGFEG
jgi:hypothetical protein